MAKGGLFMTKTKNYALTQWGPADPIRRADFNRDNAILDGVLGEMPKVAAGAYVGDGEETRVIELPFTPRVVYVTDAVGRVYNNYSSTYYYIGGAATAELPCIYQGVEYVTLVEGGFQVVQQTVTANSQTHVYMTNSKNNGYRYLAIG
jgi:hypothetical protein